MLGARRLSHSRHGTAVGIGFHRPEAVKVVLLPNDEIIRVRTAPSSFEAIEERRIGEDRHAKFAIDFVELKPHARDWSGRRHPSPATSRDRDCSSLSGAVFVPMAMRPDRRAVEQLAHKLA